MVSQPSYWKVLTRRKFIATEGQEYDTKLNRVLGLYDLTALGVGSTLGAGVYVLAGQIARDQAGPSVMLSFAIAALASLLAGVCYAEFGARVPKAGSAYVYSYVCIGEFAAFVIGWNLILEYVIGTAAVCRGISLYLDAIINDTLKNTFAEVSPMHVSFLGSYFDFFAFGLVVVFGIALAFGVKNSTMANNFVTGVNIFILLFVIIAGSIKADFSNWSIDIDNVHLNETVATDLGTGGYFPFGFQGTLKGAATCFFGFVGFDCIATTGEEVCNPRKNIPRSILLSLLIIFLCYFGVSTVLTLMVPYYLQDSNAPLPYAFKAVGWTFAMWIVSVGGLIGLLASLFGALFPLSRVMYSMAEDGLLFSFLGKVSARYRVPVIGSIFAAIITAVIAGLFDLDQLVSLLAIGTLLAYSVVAISITLLRYMEITEDTDIAHENGNRNQTSLSENSLLTSHASRVTFKCVMVQLFNCKRVQIPNALSTRIVGTLITLFCLLSLAIGLIFMYAYDALVAQETWALVLLVVLIILTLLLLLSICLQPRELSSHIFRVPFVPMVPAMSIFINIYLMLQLDVMTWIRFGVWMAIGIPIYVACWCMYDIKNPLKRNPSRLSFARALQASSIEARPTVLNGHLKENGINTLTRESLNSNGTNGSNGTTLSIRNEQSVKSLDEILALDDVSGDLIELKHANGNKFYIEDTRSNNSTVSTLSEKGAGFSANGTTEEEKSVIAMLDNVLQDEDDDGGGLATPGTFIYDRKISVDSEMLPSLIESTTVAMVHSSSDSSENDLEELTEEVEHEVGMNSDSLDANFDIYAESHRVAEVLVDDVLYSEQLWKAVEEHLNKKQDPTEENTLEQPGSSQVINESNILLDNNSSVRDGTTPNFASPSPRRSYTDESILVENPLRSEIFKHKLSQIILHPPILNVKSNKDTKNTTPENITPEHITTTTTATQRPQLKHSKSEADLHNLVLKAIEGTQSVNLDDIDRGASNVTAIKNTGGIPKAPKFDPVLYKTLNSINTNRTRPSLEKLLIKDTYTVSNGGVAARQPTDDDDSVLPFKEKLEALLKRGPTHLTQKRSEITNRRPKSMGSLREATPTTPKLESLEPVQESHAELNSEQRRRTTMPREVLQGADTKKRDRKFVKAAEKAELM